jgi:hypothetical protein|tara:strand:- start:366 stop:641 length:276 start_codon:yes stop_codon:yes gene_type:complete
MASGSHDSSENARGNRSGFASTSGALGTLASTAALAIAGWSLQRTVAHDGELARLGAGRDTAVLGAKLDAVNERLARLETTLAELRKESAK